MNLRENWEMSFGAKSHLNLFGKIVLGALVGWLWLIIILSWMAFDLLFTKKEAL